MDPMTILSLAKGAKWAWDQYKQKSAASPATSIDELRTRLDASDELVRNSFELIEAMEQQIHDHGARIDAQATQIAQLQGKTHTLVVFAAAAAVVATGSLCGMLWLALR